MEKLQIYTDARVGPFGIDSEFLADVKMKDGASSRRRPCDSSAVPCSYICTTPKSPLRKIQTTSLRNARGPRSPSYHANYAWKCSRSYVRWHFWKFVSRRVRTALALKWRQTCLVRVVQLFDFLVLLVVVVGHFLLKLYVFATHVSKRFGFTEMCGSLLYGCSLGWGRSPYRVAERSPDTSPENNTCGCLRHICHLSEHFGFVEIVWNCVEVCGCSMGWLFLGNFFLFSLIFQLRRWFTILFLNSILYVYGKSFVKRNNRIIKFNTTEDRTWLNPTQRWYK